MLKQIKTIGMSIVLAGTILVTGCTDTEYDNNEKENKTQIETKEKTEQELNKKLNKNKNQLRKKRRQNGVRVVKNILQKMK